MRSTTAGENAPHGALCGGAGQMGSNDLPPYAPSTPEGKPAAHARLSPSSAARGSPDRPAARPSRTPPDPTTPTTLSAPTTPTTPTYAGVPAAGAGSRCSSWVPGGSCADEDGSATVGSGVGEAGGSSVGVGSGSAVRVGSAGGVRVGSGPWFPPFGGGAPVGCAAGGAEADASLPLPPSPPFPLPSPPARSPPAPFFPLPCPSSAAAAPYPAFPRRPRGRPPVPRRLVPRRTGTAWRARRTRRRRRSCSRRRRRRPGRWRPYGQVRTRGARAATSGGQGVDVPNSRHPQEDTRPARRT